MNIKQYLSAIGEPRVLREFCSFYPELKLEYKTLDGYAFDFNESITSVKLYYKIYTRKNIFDSSFFDWFSSSNLTKGKLQKYSGDKETAKNSIKGFNFAVKYNLDSKNVSKSFYFGDKYNSSLVISESLSKIYQNRYYYIYNNLAIRLINKLLNLKMPNHKEAIELSFRKSSVHCSVFPKINKKNLNINDAKRYCENQTKNLLLESSLSGQSEALSIHCDTKNSTLITKGYSSGNNLQKLYFGCFDWESSIYSN
tara:strand:+ start:3757 stop:4518 length:762 start_codon:yes stop_codon:yes gene_type:complete